MMSAPARSAYSVSKSRAFTFVLITSAPTLRDITLPPSLAASHRNLFRASVRQSRRKGDSRVAHLDAASKEVPSGAVAADTTSWRSLERELSL